MASRGNYKYGFYAPNTLVTCAQDPGKAYYVGSNANIDLTTELKYRWPDKKYRLFHIFGGWRGELTPLLEQPELLFGEQSSRLCAVFVKGPRGGVKTLWERDTYDTTAFDTLPDLSCYGGDD